MNKEFKYYTPLSLNLHCGEFLMDMKDCSVWQVVDVKTSGNYDIFHLEMFCSFDNETTKVNRKLNLMDELQTKTPRYIKIPEKLANKLDELMLQ